MGLGSKRPRRASPPVTDSVRLKIELARSAVNEAYSAYEDGIEDDDSIDIVLHDYEALCREHKVCTGFGCFNRTRSKRCKEHQDA